jgi:hypothetical protein
MAQRKVLHEAGTLLAEGKTPGTFRVCIITEGEGSTGVYSRDLLQKTHASGFFDEALSFMSHPKDPNKPWERPATDIWGQLVGGTTLEEHDGILGLWGDFEPDDSHPEKRAFLEKYAPKLGLSIYAAGAGEVDKKSGKLVVHEFDGEDPYKSVDIVVAAGRGGKFDRQAEAALRVLESSVGIPAGTNPDVTSAQENQKEGKMDEKILEALNALKTMLSTFLTESKAAETARLQAEADAKAKEPTVTEALEAYAGKVTAINAEKDLSPAQVAELLVAAKEGKDVAPLIESAKKVAEEFKTRLGESAAPYGRVTTGAGRDEDYTVAAEGWNR